MNISSDSMAYTFNADIQYMCTNPKVYICCTQRDFILDIKLNTYQIIHDICKNRLKHILRHKTLNDVLQNKIRINHSMNTKYSNNMLYT